MTKEDLLIWRRVHKLKQHQLGAMLKPPKTRQTISCWEGGHTPLPVNLAADLERLTFTLAPKAPPAVEFLTIETARKYPDLDVYAKGFEKDRGIGSEHPNVMLGPNPTGGRWPLTVLDSPEYLAAVEAKRARRR